MKVNTQDLKDAINLCVAGTSSKDLVAQMSHVVFNNEEILSYNDKISICVPFDTGVSCSIPAEDLQKVLNGITEKEVDITVEEGDAPVVNIKSKSTEVVIFTEVESRIVEDFFAAVDFDAMTWQPVPKNLLDQLALARFSASSNALDANNLFCVHIKGTKVSSGDGHRLSVLELAAPMKEVLIPNTTVNDIIGFKNFEEYAIETGWIHFTSSDGIILSCKTVLGEFPDFTPIFKNFQSSAETQIDSNLIPVLQNLGGLVEGTSDFMKSVKITVGKGETKISGRKEGLQIEKFVENTNEEDEVEFNISPVFLAYILTLTNSLQIGETSAMFSSKTFKHIVQLPLV
jgi:hypothetical protein